MFGVAAEPEAPAAPPQAEPTPRAEPRPQPQRPTPSFELPAAGARVVHVRRRGGMGCLVGLVILLVVVAAPIFAIVSFVGSVDETFDDITDVFEAAPDLDVPPSPEEPAAPAQPPTGLRGASMVAPANFGKALRRIDEAGIGKVTFIRLSPDRVDAQLVKGSQQRSAQVDFEGEFRRGPAAPGGSTLSTIAFSAIDRSAPARLVRGSAARFDLRTKGINYLVLSPWPGAGPRWVAYFKNGVYVEGDRNGKVVRKISGP